MKTFKLALGAPLLFGLLAFIHPSYASLSLDGDRMQATLVCRTPGIADGGYQVALSEGGLVFHRVAKVMEITFHGASEIGSYEFSLEQQDGHHVYVDSATHGRDFSLTLYGAEQSGESGVRAQLNADTRAGRVSSKLLCEPVYHILNSDME